MTGQDSILSSSALALRAADSWCGHLFAAVLAGLILSGCALPEGESPGPLPRESSTAAPVPPEDEAVSASDEAPIDNSGAISLEKCVSVALQKNLAVKMADLQAESRKAEIGLARAPYDGSIDLLGGEFSDADSNSGNMVLRKKFLTGTELRAEAGTLFLDNSDRTEGETTTGTEYAIGLRQALLQGASRSVNEAPIAKARIISADAGVQTRIQVYEMLRGIESAYWTASYASELENTLQASLERVRKVRTIIARRTDEGAATPLDLLEADAAVARAEGSLYNATKSCRDSLDQMWFIMGYPLRVPSTVQLKPLSEAGIEVSGTAPDAHFAKASAEAPEVILLANDIRVRELDMKVAKNRMLPKVYAELNWGSDEFISSGTTTSTTDNSQNEWSALLRVSMPWTFREEKAQLEIARSELARSKVAQENGMRVLNKDINETCRAITAAHQQLDAASRGSLANRKKFDEQQQRYEAGLASARDVMEAETELRQAEARELEDRLRLVLASILLARQDGSIMQRHGLVF